MFFCHLFYRGHACLVLLLSLSFSIIFTTLYKSPYLPWLSFRDILNIAILIFQYFSIVSLFLNEIWYLYSEIVGLTKIWQNIFLTKQIRLHARTNPGIVRKQMLEINIFRRDFSTRQSKIFFYKILLHNNLTHLLKKKFSKTFYIRRRITVTKDLNYAFLNCPLSLHCSFLCNFVNFENHKPQPLKKWITLHTCWL